MIRYLHIHFSILCLLLDTRQYYFFCFNCYSFNSNICPSSCRVRLSLKMQVWAGGKKKLQVRHSLLDLVPYSGLLPTIPPIFAYTTPSIIRLAEIIIPLSFIFTVNFCQFLLPRCNITYALTSIQCCLNLLNHCTHLT